MLIKLLLTSSGEIKLLARKALHERSQKIVEIGSHERKGVP